MTDVNLFDGIDKLIVDTFVTARESAIGMSTWYPAEVVYMYSYPYTRPGIDSICRKYIISRESNLEERFSHLKVKKFMLFKNGKYESQSKRES